MKKIYYFIIITLVIIISYFVYTKYFSVTSLGENVFKEIENHNLYITPVINGYLLIDHNELTSNIITKHILLESGQSAEIEKIIDYKYRMFDIPYSIIKHKFIKSYSIKSSYLTAFSLSERDYNEVYKYSYKSYQEFVDDNIKIYSKEKSFRYDIINKQLIYSIENYSEIRLEYKVETKTENFLMTMVFLNDSGDKKLAAIFTVKI